MHVIEVNGITKDYGNHKGVFDVDFTVSDGEVMGFLGPNGAGKTTTIRNLMGFIKPDKGSVKIGGLDCFTDAHVIRRNLGYLPGEISFVDNMTGTKFIKFIADMKGCRNDKKIQELISFFELDPSGKIKKMSKGMKQKIGIVCAFMQSPDILILDEPTSGLDPLMQNKFVELIAQEKKRGTTVLMSSHLFEEVEHTCDRVAIIKDGQIIAIEDMKKLRKNKSKFMKVYLSSEQDALKLKEEIPESKVDGCKVSIHTTGNIDTIIKQISKYEIKDLNVRPQTLEELFLHFYDQK